MRLLFALMLLAAGEAAAQTVPLPRPRPAVEAHPPPAPQEAAEPSACRLRLTAELAIAPSVPLLESKAGCMVADAVRLEAIVLPDKSRVAVTPPAMLRCGMAEAIAHWVREDVAGAAERLGSALRRIDNAASFDCRGRNRIAGAQLSEHGKANALDIAALRLADGKVVHLTDPHVAHGFREEIRKSACARFSTVLGPGSDGYHEEHVHVDLMERAAGRFSMCRWQVHDAELAEPAPAETVPLPLPRPKIEPASVSTRPKL